MIRKLPSTSTTTRKVRALKESVFKYKTRKRTLGRPIRYKPIPLKPEDWDKYRGETIAFVDDQILAHDKNLDVVLQEVWDKYRKKPHQVELFIVPPFPRMIR